MNPFDPQIASFLHAKLRNGGIKLML